MTKFYFLGLVVVCLLEVGIGDEVNFTDCGSDEGATKIVEISGCDKSENRCGLKRNTNATISLTFTPKKDIEQLKVIVHGIILDAPIPFPIPNPDGCKNSGINCPLKAGELYKYFAEFPILKKYPRVTVDVKWELKYNDEEVACVIIPCKIG